MRSSNILVLTYWSYKEALIQTYTLPYLKIIKKSLPSESKIYLVTLEQKSLKMTDEELKRNRQLLAAQGIELIPLSHHKWGLMGFLFGVWYGIKFIFFIPFRRVKYIHSWCTTAGSLGYALSLLTGRKLIIDSYEPHAEAMVENGTWQRSDFQFQFLFLLEKQMTKRANALIGVTYKMKDYANEIYNFSPPSFFVKPACVEVKKFSKRRNEVLSEALGLTNKIVCVYAGKIGGIYLSKEIFDFFKVAHDYWGGNFRALLLTSHEKKELHELAKASGFDTTKMIVRFVEHSKIAEYIKLGTFAITPVKPVPTKRFCTPIKDAEYWAAGLPVVITKNISDDSDIIEQHNIGAIIQEFTTKGYLDSIKKIDNLIKSESPESLSSRIVAVAKKYRNFSIAEEVYKKIYG